MSTCWWSTPIPRDDAYKLVRRLSHVLGVEPHMYAASEAERLHAVLSRMTDGGVMLTEVAVEVAGVVREPDEWPNNSAEFVQLRDANRWGT